MLNSLVHVMSVPSYMLANCGVLILACFHVHVLTAESSKERNLSKLGSRDMKAGQLRLHKVAKFQVDVLHSVCIASVC